MKSFELPQPECEDDYAFMPNYDQNPMVPLEVTPPSVATTRRNDRGKIQSRGETRTNSEAEGQA
jgi:hypothetical protein